MEETLRIDKWLWYARFFKSRALASRMVSSGRLRLNGESISKPHRQVLPDMVLVFPQGETIRTIKILALATRRGPASEAQTLYEDLDPPQAKEIKTEIGLSYLNLRQETVAQVVPKKRQALE